MSAHKVLFLFVSIGSGHLLAAKAIEQEIRGSCPGWETTCLDPVTTLFPGLLKLSSATYFKCLEFAPELYGFLWNNEKLGEWTTDMVEAQPLKQLDRLIEQEDPAVIVCTQEFPCALVAALRKKGWLDRPVVAVTTDFALSAGWPTSYVDKYIVASEELRQTLQRRIVAASKIEATGIPIASVFAEETDQEKVRRQMGLQPLPTLLIVAGGLMEGPYRVLVNTLKKIMVYLDHLPWLFQTLVVTGTNEKLRGELIELTQGASKPITVLGYVHNMHDLMGISDLLITKPGGTITAQALVKGMPMILVKPLPGQEEANAQFVIRNGAAIGAEDAAEVVAAIHDLWGNTARLAEMRQKALALAKPNASRDAVQVIRSLLEGR